MPKENVLRQGDAKPDLRTADEAFWAALKKKAKYAIPERIGEQTVEEGSWKLVVVHGTATTYKLFHLASDPQMKKDLAAQLDNLVLRLRGKMERQEAVEFKATARKELPGTSIAHVAIIEFGAHADAQLRQALQEARKEGSGAFVGWRDHHVACK